MRRGLRAMSSATVIADNTRLAARLYAFWPIIHGRIRRRFGWEMHVTCIWRWRRGLYRYCVAFIYKYGLRNTEIKLGCSPHLDKVNCPILIMPLRMGAWLAVVYSYCGANSIASVVHMEHQHTTHIVTCGKSNQIHKNDHRVEVLWLRRTRSTPDNWTSEIHSYAISIKMPYNILCYSRRPVRSKNGDVWLDTGDYFLFPSL